MISEKELKELEREASQPTLEDRKELEDLVKFVDSEMEEWKAARKRANDKIRALRKTKKETLKKLKI